MKRTALALLLLLPTAASACDPCGMRADDWRALKGAGFELADADARDATALALAGCLGHPDPGIRDGLAYEGLAHWLRAGALSPEARSRLADVLLAPGPRGPVQREEFRAPFVALVLAEVVRSDRVSPWIGPAGRDLMVDRAAGYLAGVRDYRGFVDGEGWRHGVAHGADWVMQLVLNPAVDEAQVRQLLDAVAAQVAPAGAPPYVHGEPERLARPVLFALQRGALDEAGWQAWLDRVADPAPLPAWSQAYGSEADLARRHNLRVFLLALYAGLAESGDETLRARLPPVVAALRAMD